MNALVDQSLVETGRLLRRWSRQQEVLTSTLVLPILLLLMYKLVLGKTLGAVGGVEPIYGFVPMIAVAGAMYGAMGTGMSLFGERESGLLRRFWVLPVHRGAGLIGRLLAECVRAFAATVVVIVVGMLLGLRFQNGWLGVFGVLAVPVIVIAGFTPLVVMVGVSRIGGQVTQIFAIVVLVGMFFNSGFVAVDNYPGWLQPIVAGQPMSCAIEAMRGFLLGGPIATPLLQTIAWSAGLIVVFGGLAVRGYRRAAES
ncbi:ABC transporter permease [Nocardia cyriacigeorgica]|uniref:Transport permease protein n=2 Tax=Nocardia cyriacigeorgica TaxID=135487 RepID=H6QZV2_NOCCG|nr:ABC transporter permease [Nocardia cyriacigeorgica]MBF6425761.1 ABC transporter permease [Nocardia cyriacigeorgica]NEW33266.1 ABC transporter permease [Nocardia cyriacigeorgica]CCF61617.1 ABC drug resistance transporter, permease component [Nocardia cyriacigeorgica GUH-2]